MPKPNRGGLEDLLARTQIPRIFVLPHLTPRPRPAGRRGSKKQEEIPPAPPLNSTAKKF